MSGKQSTAKLIAKFENTLGSGSSRRLLVESSKSQAGVKGQRKVSGILGRSWQERLRDNIEDRIESSAVASPRLRVPLPESGGLGEFGLRFAAPISGATAGPESKD